MDKNQQREEQSGRQDGASSEQQQQQRPAHSSAFKEPANTDRKQTMNPEELAASEQERKETLTERD